MLIAILFAITGYKNQKRPEYKPLFFSMANEWQEIAQDKVIFEYTIKSSDSAYADPNIHNVRLLSNNKGQPRLFFSEIETTVCADGECKLANINVYWNLLGNYVGYGIFPKLPLTKYDHVSFEKEDYAKLHQLFLDDNSILKRRKISDLVDTVSISSSNTSLIHVDAISGATRTEIKESVVKGGLYSCYTLWHIVHGEAKDKMKEHVQSMHSDSLTAYFLYAPYEDYQKYGLKQLPKKDFKHHTAQIVNIFKTNDALTRGYILKKIPDADLSIEKIATQLYNTFPGVDSNARTLLLKKLENANSIAVEIVSQYLDYLTKNQLILYLTYLKENPGKHTKKVKRNLIRTSKNKRYAYSHLVKEYLKNRK
ncbi:MAG: hypothetical protein ABJN84_08805 [Flavobacteriaceae bacterium]|uniref:hypothetical protein n=1 Tax=Maribacter dokdonensis TaxID=320912 RepID=UPI00328E74DD